MSRDQRNRTALAIVPLMVMVLSFITFSAPHRRAHAQTTASASPSASASSRSASTSAAQPTRGAPSVGTEVVIKAGASMKVGNEVVDTGGSHRVYQVERIQGEWLWLVGPLKKVAGWARAVDVIPLNQAIEYYTAEINRNARVPWPHFSRGLIYEDFGKLDEARSDYSEAIRMNPKFVDALINRGNIWLRRRTPDRAISDYSQAIEADPKSVLAHLNRGIAWQSKREWAKAQDDYNEAIRLGWRTPATYNNRGHVREMQGDYDGAIADHTEAIQLEPNYTLAWMNRGSAHEAKGEYEPALADYTEATRLKPDLSEGYARRAWILATSPDARIRNGKEAVALATKACDLEKEPQAKLFDVRAAAHAEDGDFAQAIFWETRALPLASRKIGAEGKLLSDLYRKRLALYQASKPFRSQPSESIR